MLNRLDFSIEAVCKSTRVSQEKESLAVMSLQNYHIVRHGSSVRTLLFPTSADVYALTDTNLFLLFTKTTFMTKVLRKLKF